MARPWGTNTWQLSRADVRCCFRRGRGIPGFTGTTPAPHLRAPVKPLEDPSAGYAINAYDQRRPWTSGLRGYTGHQLPPHLQGVLFLPPPPQHLRVICFRLMLLSATWLGHSVAVRW